MAAKLTEGEVNDSRRTRGDTPSTIRYANGPPPPLKRGRIYYTRGHAALARHGASTPSSRLRAGIPLLRRTESGTPDHVRGDDSGKAQSRSHHRPTRRGMPPFLPPPGGGGSEADGGGGQRLPSRPAATPPPPFATRTPSPPKRGRIHHTRGRAFSSSRISRSSATSAGSGAGAAGASGLAITRLTLRTSRKMMKARIRKFAACVTNSP